MYQNCLRIARNTEYWVRVTSDMSRSHERHITNHTIFSQILRQFYTKFIHSVQVQTSNPNIYTNSGCFSAFQWTYRPPRGQSLDGNERQALRQAPVQFSTDYNNNTVHGRYISRFSCILPYFPKKNANISVIYASETSIWSRATYLSLVTRQTTGAVFLRPRGGFNCSFPAWTWRPGSSEISQSISSSI